MTNPKRLYLEGKRFNKLIVIRELSKRSSRSVVWECLCDCGEKVYPTTSRLIKGRAVSCRLCKINDLSGKNFGKLTAIKRLPKSKTGCRIWLCKCSCGNMVEVKSAYLKNGNTKSCGCLRLKYTDPTMRAKKIIYTLYKLSAKKKGLEFSISFEKFIDITSLNCFYCGSEPKNIKVDGKIRKTQYKYNGLDRMDNSKGYIEGNVAPCCKMCNMAKKDMAIDKFLIWGLKLSSKICLIN